MSSPYTELMGILYKFLTPPEIARVRLSINAGARGYMLGKYTIEQIEKSAERICSLIQGAHIAEVKAYEADKGVSFMDVCKDLVVKAVQEDAMRSVSPYRVMPITEEEQKEEEKRVRLF